MQNIMNLPFQLQKLLPNGYSYKLKKWLPDETRQDHFETTFFTNVYTENEAQEWWHKFNAKSNTTMRVRTTCPKTGKVNSFKIFLRCLHQGRAERSERSEGQQKGKRTSLLKRNTNCPAGMIVAIRRLIKYSRSKLRDPIDPVHPCEIQLKFMHNHPTNNADSLKFRPVSKEVSEKLLNLYRIGHSPTTALEILKTTLKIEHGSRYNRIVTDRFHCPDKSFCYRLYYKHFGKDYAAMAKKDISSLLTDKIFECNKVLGEGSVAKVILGNDYVIAVCTPVMKKAHILPQSGETVYLELSESPNTKENSEHHVILLIAHCRYGGIPLGALLATSNSPEVLISGFNLLKQLLPKNAFFGKKLSGPHAFFIEDSENQRSALHSAWPVAQIVTCTFRLLQSLWRCLFEEKNNVLSDHRLYLLYLAKTLLFAADESEMGTKYHNLRADNIAGHYPHYMEYIESLWKKRHLWAICFHKLLPLADANNYYEAAARVHKDKIFEQTKQFNSVQILDYLITCVDLYYRTKIFDLLHNKCSHIFLTHLNDSVPSHIQNNIKQVAGNYFLVPSESNDKKLFTVDAELNVCSCSIGIRGILCLHQYWVFLKMPSDLFKVGFCDSDFKRKLFSVVTKNSLPAVSDKFVSCKITEQPLKQNPDNSNFQSVVYPCSKVCSKANSSNSTADDCPGNNILAHVQNSSDFMLLPSNSSKETAHTSASIQVSSASFVNNVSMQTGTLVSGENSCVKNSLLSPQTENNSGQCFPNAEKHLPRCEVNEQENINDIELSKRVKEVLRKFEIFCERVKQGLKTRPDDFLPALEIMMKTLERKGNSSELIISGLSFFGVFSAPSVVHRKRKKSTVPNALSEEIIPKVHGRQMITYGKKCFPLAHSLSSVGSKTVFSNILVSDTKSTPNCQSLHSTTTLS